MLVNGTGRGDSAAGAGAPVAIAADAAALAAEAAVAPDEGVTFVVDVMSGNWQWGAVKENKGGDVGGRWRGTT